MIRLCESRVFIFIKLYIMRIIYYIKYTKRNERIIGHGNLLFACDMVKRNQVTDKSRMRAGNVTIITMSTCFDRWWRRRRLGVYDRLLVLKWFTSSRIFLLNIDTRRRIHSCKKNLWIMPRKVVYLAQYFHIINDIVSFNINYYRCIRYLCVCRSIIHVLGHDSKYS